MKHVRSCKKICVLSLLMVCFMLIVTGCGVGEKNEKRLFEAMKENGFLDLDCDYEDYDEVRRVDQSPVPAVVTYYDYKQNGKIYTLDYKSVIVDDNSVYQVRLTIESGSETNTSIYYFEKDTYKFIGKK